MGIFDTFRNGLTAAGWQRAIYSPLAPNPNHLEAVKWAALTGDTFVTKPSRGDAMAVPAIVRGRGLICSTIARCPLTAKRTDGTEVTAPWLTRTDGPVSPFHRMLWTADDLLFYGWSLWAIKRDFDGKVIDARRVPYDSWEFDTDGAIMVNGTYPDSEDVVLIPGIHEGVLSFGAETINQARGLLASAARAATTPAAMVELSQTNDYPMTDEEVKRLVDSWAAARRGVNGGVAFTSHGIETKEHGAAKEHLLIEGRSASAIDLARLLGIPASMIDAQQAGSSLSYSNTASRMNELISFGIAPIMAAIQSRLELDDVVPRGTRLIFDTSDIVSTLGMDPAAAGTHAAGDTNNLMDTGKDIPREQPISNDSPATNNGG